MSRKLTAALVALLVVAGAFGAGYQMGGDRALHLPVYTADCQTGADVASCLVGDSWYGFRSTVSWTDSTGSLHDQGWPDCLPRMSQVKGARIAAAVLWVGGSGLSTVVWVDCQNH